MRAERAGIRLEGFLQAYLRAKRAGSMPRGLSSRHTCERSEQGQRLKVSFKRTSPAVAYHPARAS